MIRASTFTRVNGSVSFYAINVYKNGLPFKRTLARDELHGLLMASSNENSGGFQFRMYLIKCLTIID